MKIDFEKIIRNLEAKANAIYTDNKRLRELLEVAKQKAQGNKQLMEVWSDLKLLIELVKDWMKGDYTNLSKNTVIMVIISLVYLVSPIDLIPDFLIGGFLDDAAVIAYVIKKISVELNEYKEWKNIDKDDIVDEIIVDTEMYED